MSITRFMCKKKTRDGIVFKSKREIKYFLLSKQNPANQKNGTTCLGIIEGIVHYFSMTCSHYSLRNLNNFRIHTINILRDKNCTKEKVWTTVKFCSDFLTHFNHKVNRI